jgi:hypothetical protein
LGQDSPHRHFRRPRRQRRWTRRLTANEPGLIDHVKNFIGSSRALSGVGVASAALRVSVSIQEVWAVIGVETSGCGFLPDRRPEILYERHTFRAAALRSTSWGLGQILGMNCAMAGFSDVEAFVAAMSDSEDAQLAAVTAFIDAAGLTGALRTHDWASFARGYNGPAYARNQYDTRLRGEFQKYATGILPDLDVRAAQLYLQYTGFKPGPVDGFLGNLTRSAIVEYQIGERLPPTGTIDQALLSRLAPAPLP